MTTATNLTISSYMFTDGSNICKIRDDGQDQMHCNVKTHIFKGQMGLNWEGSAANNT